MGNITFRMSLHFLLLLLHFKQAIKPVFFRNSTLLLTKVNIQANLALIISATLIYQSKQLRMIYVKTSKSRWNHFLISTFSVVSYPLLSYINAFLGPSTFPVTLYQGESPTDDELVKQSDEKINLDKASRCRLFALLWASLYLSECLRRVVEGLFPPGINF